MRCLSSESFELLLELLDEGADEGAAEDGAEDKGELVWLWAADVDA